MVEALIALLATLGGLAATGLVLTRAFNERRPHLYAWSVTVLGLAVAFASMTAGGLAGYSSMLFRLAELGSALLAPVWLAVGLIVIVAGPVPMRFATWLIAISFTVVAVVVLLADPLKTETFGKSLPKPGDRYEIFPVLMINVAHIYTVIALVVCAIVVAVRLNGRDRQAAALMTPIAMMALAGVLLVAGAGYLPGAASVLALAIACGLIGWVAVKTDVDPPVKAPQRRPQGRRARTDPFDEYGAKEYGAKERPYGAQEPPYAAQEQAYGGFDEPREPAWGGAEPAFNGAQAGRHDPSGVEGMYGQITVFTLVEGRAEYFDRLAADAVQASRMNEPDLLIFSSHHVAGAPTQRIFYQLFRDEAAFGDHQRQPHIQRFLAESRPHVVATNVIELALDAAKVVPLPSLSGDFPR